MKSWIEIVSNNEILQSINLKDQMNRQVTKKEQEIKEGDGSFEEENYS